MSFKTSFLRFLTGQKPLARLLPNYRELLADPARVLDRAPVKIRPLRLVRLALFLFVATPLLPFALNLDNLLGKVHWVVDVLVFGIWPLLALLMLLLPVRDRLILGRNDVTFQHGRLCVICPWQLFNVAGNAHGHDPEQFLVAVPVDPNETHRVVLIQNDVVLARGAGVHTPEFRFHSAREVHLTGRYQASPTEVGSLLLTLGRRLGAGDARHEPALVSQLVESIGLLHDLPDGTPMPMRLDDRGWVALPLLNLSLAPLCCVCGVPTERCLDVEVGRGDFVGRLLHVTLGETSVKVPVPICAACLARRRRRLWIGRMLGVLAGLLVVAGLVVQVVWPGMRLLPFDLLVMLVAIGGAIFPIVGFLIGSSAAGKPPIEVGYYDHRAGYVTLRLHRRQVRRSAADAVTASGRTGNQPEAG